MTEGEHSHPDAPGVSTDQLAEAMASAQVEAAHTLAQEAQLDRAEDTAEQALQAAHEAASEAIDARYHNHPELEHDHHGIEERLTAIEAFITGAVAQAESTAQATTEEVVEPHSDASAEVHTETPATTRTAFGFRRGRR